MGVDLSFESVKRSRWGIAAMAVVVVSAAVVLVDGVVNGHWIQVLMVTLLAGSAVGWWRDKALSNVVMRVLVTVFLVVSGILVLVTQDSVLVRIAGGLLIVSSACGALALFVRAGRDG